MHPTFHGELLLSMRGKPADDDNHTDSSAILWISFNSLTSVYHSGLALIHYSNVRHSLSSTIILQQPPAENANDDNCNSCVDMFVMNC